ncbi:VOC family protein [soil metagenome]
MTITRVSAELLVADHAAAVSWYRTLFGRPADEEPMAGLAEWQITASGWLQVSENADQAGQSAATIGVDDLDQHAAGLAARGVELQRQTTTRGQKLGIINDPDGNLIVFAQDLVSSRSRKEAGQ